jgi:CRP-like cAMP-binding protein
VEYGQDQPLFEEGRPANRLIVICRGIVGLFAHRDNGDQMLFRVARAGEALGLAAVLRGRPYALSARTLVPCQLRLVDQDALIELLDDQPGLWKWVALEGAARHYATLEELKKAPLVKLIECLLSFDRGAQPSNAPPAAYRVPMTNQALADVAGVTDRTIRSYVAELRNNRLVERPDDWLRVVDPEGLRKHLEQIRRGKRY